jgi:hypothetical protein
MGDAGGTEGLGGRTGYGSVRKLVLRTWANIGERTKSLV